MNSERLSLALLVALGVVWGSAFIAIRYVLDEGASPFLFVLVRMLTSAPLMAVIALCARERRPAWRDLVVSAVLGGAFVMGGYQVMLFWGEQFTAGGIAGVLVAASPLFTAVLSWFLLRQEAFGRVGAFGLAVGFGGVALLFEPEIASGGTSSTLGLLSVLAAAFAFAIGSVLLRKWRKGGETYWGASVEFAAGALFALPFVVLFEPRPYFPLGTGALLATGYLVGVAGVLGFAMYFALHRRVGPSRANLVSFISPLSALGVGGLVLGEQYAPIQLGGFALIVLGLFLLQRDWARRSAP
ncbi:MAG: DMT family transporter [Thermoplasmata archaeon]